MQPTQLNESQQSPSPSPSMSSAVSPADGAMPTFDTEPDEFGLFRSYISCPTFEPNKEIPLDSICDSEGFAVAKVNFTKDWSSVFGPRSSKSPMESANPNSFAPFLGATVSCLMSWFYGGSNMKSVTELDKLVNDVILANDFDRAHLKGFSATRELKRLDEYEQHTKFPSKDGWKETSVKIRLPAEKAHLSTSEEKAPEFEVNSVFYRPLIGVIISAFQEAAAETFHITPFQLFWQRSKNEPAERVISELYNSDAMIVEHQKIQAQPREPGCTLETVVGAIMLWSDSTHLTTFGKLTSFAAHHIAYIPFLPDTIQDIYTSVYNFSALANVLTHLKCELIHAIWMLLLDPAFMHAYEHGIVIQFADGISRRIFPRLFTYSADYPEKVLLASTKFLGKCPCLRCLVTKDQIGQMGTKLDARHRENERVDNDSRRQKIKMTRGWIFERGYGVASNAVERILAPTSMVPTRNAFSQRLSKFGFNFHLMFVVNLLHKFELGVWKAIFTHLMRILYAAAGDCIQTLNKQYRQVPTFSGGTIRHFSRNASGIKKLAARDFEDLLQCAIPVFEGLLPSPHNKIVLDLLFSLAAWHAYAKLRLHTKMTLGFLEASTTVLGQILRWFVNITCRCKAAMAAKTRTDKPPPPTTKKSGARSKKKKFNLCTYKLHALRDYAKTIRLFDTTDSYNSQVGELKHRRVKHFYARTNKVGFTRQIAKHQWRFSRNTRIRRGARLGRKRSWSAPLNPRGGALASEAITSGYTEPDTPPTVHHHISNSNRYHDNLTAWLGAHSGDPALMNFLPRLKDHILAQILGQEFNRGDYEFTDEEQSCITFVHNHSMNPRTHADIMVLSHGDDEDEEKGHPYWYAHIIGIFYVNVRHVGPTSKGSNSQKIEFLDLEYRAGWKARCLYCIGFADDQQFSFLDLKEVIRGVHLLSAFAHGRTSANLAPSIARQPSEKHEDWVYYYIGMFVDRDMVMRFTDGAVGHKSTQDATKTFSQDSYESEDDHECEMGAQEEGSGDPDVETGDLDAVEIGDQLGDELSIDDEDELGVIDEEEAGREEEIEYVLRKDFAYCMSSYS
ncbi:hypothetical protein V8E52_005251 [Russula decolorans]